jgi:hypothetical protein
MDTLRTLVLAAEPPTEELMIRAQLGATGAS